MIDQDLFIWFCLTPVLMMGVYICFLLILPASDEDKFFVSRDNPSLEHFLTRIGLLEKFTGKSFTMKKRVIISIFSERKISAHDRESIENNLISAYFGNFPNRWIALRKADPFLKVIFFTCFLFGFIYFNFILLNIITPDQTSTNEVLSEENRRIILGGFNLFLCIIPLMMGLMTFALFSTILSLLCLLLPGKAKLSKALVFTEEMMKSLKPGGRKTPVTFPRRSGDYY